MTMAAAAAAAAAGRLANCRRDSIHHHPARSQQSRELNKNIHADQYKVENNPASNLDVYKVETTLNAQCPSLQEPARSSGSTGLVMKHNLHHAICQMQL
jgi:hypothetical protein